MALGPLRHAPFPSTLAALLLLSPATLHAQPDTTHRRWVYVIEQTQVQSPAIGSDGTIYIGTGMSDTSLPSNGLYAIRPNGTLKWKLTLGRSVHSSVALDAHDNLFFIAGDVNSPDTMNAALYSLDSEGHSRWRVDSIGWKVPIPNTGFTPAIAPGGTVYVSGRYSLFAVTPAGSVKWKYDFPLMDNIMSSGKTQTVGNNRSAPVIAQDGTIYVNTMRGGHGPGPPTEGGVYAFDPAGNLKWRTYDIGGTAAPVIGKDGTIYSAIGGYVTTTDTGNAARVLAIRPNGTRKWSVETQLWCEASPSIGADGTLYIGTTHHPLDVPAWFYAISPEGQIRWKYDTRDDVIWFPPALINPPDIYNSPAIDSDGRVYFGNEMGLLYCLSAEGSVVWIEDVSSLMYGSPAVAHDGTLYVATHGILNGTNHFGLIAINTGSHGLAASPWPKFRQNNANTGFAAGQTSSVNPGAAPGEFDLFPNYPNPFNPKTVIRCQWPLFAQVKLVVYDLLGREVSTLLDGVKPPGTYTGTWDAARAASGMYVARLTAGPPSGLPAFRKEVKLLLVK